MSDNFCRTGLTPEQAIAATKSSATSKPQFICRPDASALREALYLLEEKCSNFDDDAEAEAEILGKAKAALFYLECA